MTTKIVRGQLMVFTANPTDYLGSPVVPATARLHLNYVHSGDTQATDDPAVDMELQTDGTLIADFDTKDTEPGALFVSVRTTEPAAAWDNKYLITANQANPEDTPTA